jgi:uncharacterized repeat protein (TIGR03803 family)
MTGTEHPSSAGRRSPATTRWTVVLTIAFALITSSSTAQTFTILHTFTAAEGGPTWNLIRNNQGNLYGTTAIAGDLGCNFGQGCGTVFKLTAQGELEVLYSFGETPNDGLYPQAGVTPQGGAGLAGTTYGGGNNGYGTVFLIYALTLPRHHEHIFHRFDNVTDGRWPSAPLFRDRWGNLSGVTPWGGTYDCGTVFKLDKSGVFSVLHSFNPANEGCSSIAWLVGDEVGDLFGTTVFGGTNNLRTVFSLDNSGNFKTLHSFAGRRDGLYPSQGLTWVRKNFSTAWPQEESSKLRPPAGSRLFVGLPPMRAIRVAWYTTNPAISSGQSKAVCRAPEPSSN